VGHPRSVKAEPPGWDHAAHVRGDRRQRHDDAHEIERLLADHLANAHLRVYPDANHGFLVQYPELFADHVNAFLDEQP
jgi:pimeloyl-ACP methyl ester carboxylesterase